MIDTYTIHLYAVALFLIVIGVLLIVAIRRWKRSEQYLQKRDDSLIHRAALKYLRDRSWPEIALYFCAPVLYFGIIFLWGWWHNW